MAEYVLCALYGWLSDVGVVTRSFNVRDIREQCNMNALAKHRPDLDNTMLLRKKIKDHKPYVSIVERFVLQSNSIYSSSFRPPAPGWR